MALINCPECNKEISDKVEACPHCGYPFKAVAQEKKVEEEQAAQKVEIASVNIKPKNPRALKTVGIILGSIVVLAVIAFGVFSIIKTNNEKKEYNAYIDNATQAIVNMKVGADDAETIVDTTASVWYNAINNERDPLTDKYTMISGYFVDDFNSALVFYYADEATKAKVTKIKQNKSLVAGLMRDLQTTPEGLENLYTALSELYNAYQALTNLAIEPTGSYNSYSASKNEKVEKFNENYDRIQILIPAKK